MNWKEKAVLATGTQQQFPFGEEWTISLAFLLTFPEFQVWIDPKKSYSPMQEELV